MQALDFLIKATKGMNSIGYAVDRAQRYFPAAQKAYTTIQSLFDRDAKRKALISEFRRRPMRAYPVTGVTSTPAPSSSSSSSANIYPSSRSVIRFRLPSHLNRSRIRNAYRRAVHRINIRRRVRAHYANPRTKHRLPNKVASKGTRQEAKVRRFKRRLRTRRRLRRKIRRWYKMGKWILMGNFFTNEEGPSSIPVVNTDDFLTSLGVSVGQSVDGADYGGLVNPLGSMSIVTPTVSGASTFKRVVITGNVHFNIQHLSPSTSNMRYPINDSIITDFSNVIPANNTVNPVALQDRMYSVIGMSVGKFQYSNADAYFATDTPYARMPPVPIESYRWTSDTNNAFRVQDTNANTFACPYRCFWRKVYFRVDYSFKVEWPGIWGSSDPSADFTTQDASLVLQPGYSVLPPNPPFYVRLFCVRTLTDLDLSRSDFLRAVFPNNSPINSGFVRGYRRNLWVTGKSILVWHRLWMFNGQITPQFQGGENLTDGEEGHFNLGVNYRTSNLINYPTQVSSFNSSVSTNWPSAKQIGRIKFFLVCGFLSPQYCLDFNYNNNIPSDDQIFTTIQKIMKPTCSVMMNFTTYCFPRLCKPNPVLPKQFNSTQYAYMKLTSFEEKSSLTDQELEQVEKDNEVKEKTDNEVEVEEQNASEEPDIPN
ncbi:capsid protein [Circoviridae sp.]|nr:capsid protein [Circoviridae sp.]